VEHPAAERHGPLPLARYASGVDATGYPLPLVTHHVRTRPWAIPERGPPEAPIWLGAWEPSNAALVQGLTCGPPWSGVTLVVCC
jgi:hypothetical protein